MRTLALLLFLHMTAPVASAQESGPAAQDAVAESIMDSMQATINLAQKLDELEAAGPKASGQPAASAIQQQIAAQQSRVESAASRFKDSAKVQTAASNFWVMSGDSGKALGHADAAVKAAEKHLTNPRQLADALTARALAEAASGDHDAARADAQKALRMYPDDDGALLIAQMAERDGRAIRQSVTVNGKRTAPPDSVRGRTTGVAPGQPDAGRSGAQAAGGGGDAGVSIDGDVGRVNWSRVAQSLLLQNKAIDALKRGDYQAMHSFAAQAASLFPLNVNAARAAAFASSMLGRGQDAMAEVQGALRLKPDAPPLLALRARVENQLDRHDEALKDSVRALAADSRLADAWLQKARARRALGDREADWSQDLAKAVAADPAFDAMLTPEERALLAGRGGAAGASSSGAAGLPNAAAGLEAWARANLWAVALFLGIDAGMLVWLLVLIARRRRRRVEA